jgi:APA family basic amino acid/polyamine antiporter
MAREGDLPAWLAAVHPRFRVPHHAELTLGLVVCVLVLTVDLRGAIAFSSFGVLLYYLVANVAAYTQEDAVRRFPRGLQVLGGVGCIVLVATLPPLALATGVAVFAVGTGYRLSRVRRPEREGDYGVTPAGWLVTGGRWRRILETANAHRGVARLHPGFVLRRTCAVAHTHRLGSALVRPPMTVGDP